MSALVEDLRYALRVYRRNTGAVVLVLAGLAVAVGLTTALFAVMNAVMFRSVSVGNQDALRWVRAVGPPSGAESFSRTSWTLPEWRALEQSTGLGRTIGIHYSTADIVVDTSVVVRQAPIWFVGAGFFESMQANAFRGRLLVPDDQRQTVAAPIVMHHSVWTRAFGADAGVVGRTISLNGRPHTVVGIAPAGFEGPAINAPAFWVPLESYDRDWRDGASLVFRGLAYVTVLAELSGKTAGGELREDLLSKVRSVNKSVDVRLEPLNFESRFKDAAPVSFAVRSLLALVLLLGCANVAMLLLATQATRLPEFAARSALGASRARLIRQLMTEGLLLGVVGGAFGSILAFWLSKLMLSIVGVPPTISVPIDWRTLAFVAVSSIASGALASLVPALRSSQIDLRSWLGQDIAQTPRAGLFGNVVIAGQAALCITVLACTGMLAESARMAQNAGVGYDPKAVLTASLGGGVRSPADAREDARRVLAAIQTLPAIEGAAVASGSLVGGSASTLRIPTPAGMYLAYQQQTSEHYLRVLDVGLIGGRYFSQSDVERGHRVVVIGAELAHAVWGGEDAVGRDAGRLHPSLAGQTIIGVAHEALQHSLLDSGQRVSSIYRPLLKSE